MKHDPIYRQYHHNEITFSMVYAFSENFVLPLSHDEVVHGKGSLLRKMPGDEWQQFAGLRALFGYMWAHPGKQLLFMGSEFGQGERVVGDATASTGGVLQFDYHAGVQRLVRDLNAVYRGSRRRCGRRTTIPDGFGWIDSNDAHGNVLSFLRFGAQETACPVLACVANFSAMPHETTGSGCRWPAAGARCSTPTRPSTAAAAWATWAPCRRSPSRGTAGPASASIVLPPLSVLWLAPEV